MQRYVKEYDQTKYIVSQNLLNLLDDETIGTRIELLLETVKQIR